MPLRWSGSVKISNLLSWFQERSQIIYSNLLLRSSEIVLAHFCPLKARLGYERAEQGPRTSKFREFQILTHSEDAPEFPNLHKITLYYSKLWILYHENPLSFLKISHFFNIKYIYSDHCYYDEGTLFLFLLKQVFLEFFFNTQNYITFYIL